MRGKVYRRYKELTEVESTGERKRHTEKERRDRIKIRRIAPNHLGSLLRKGSGFWPVTVALHEIRKFEKSTGFLNCKFPIVHWVWQM